MTWPKRLSFTCALISLIIAVAWLLVGDLFMFLLNLIFFTLNTYLALPEREEEEEEEEFSEVPNPCPVCGYGRFWEYGRLNCDNCGRKEFL